MTAERATRWSSISGLSDGIQVGVAPGFASELGATPKQVALVTQAVSDAFAAWENAALRFELSFEAPGVAEGTSSGFEIDLFAVSATHPVFAGTFFFGSTDVAEVHSDDRPLTNGQSTAGLALTGADIFINSDLLLGIAAAFELSEDEQLAALQRLVMHELGHALGLEHPNSNNPFFVGRNFDTDLDPFNAIPIDPNTPFADLRLSENRDDTAIMSNRPCGEPPVDLCPALFFTSLQPDDRGGRDVLYPAPEPSSELLSGAALLALALRRRIQRAG